LVDFTATEDVMSQQKRALSPWPWPWPNPKPRLAFSTNIPAFPQHGELIFDGMQLQSDTDICPI